MGKVVSFNQPKFVYCPGVLVKHADYGDGTIIEETSEHIRGVEFPVYDDQTEQMIDLLVAEVLISDLELISVPSVLRSGECDVIEFGATN